MGTTTELSVVVLLLSAVGVVCAGRGASKFYCQRSAPMAIGVLAVAAVAMLTYGRLSEGFEVAPDVKGSTAADVLHGFPLPANPEK